MATPEDPNRRVIYRGSYDGLEAFVAPEQTFFDAVATWDATTTAGPEAVIRAACDALVADLDTPALRDLAGLSVDARRSDAEPLATQALLELGIPRASEVPIGRHIGEGGRLERRPGTDRLRLQVVHTVTDVGEEYEVQVYVNDVEMTSKGAGMGMDPYDVHVPTNHLAATTEPHRTPIARCSCGVYGCGVTDVTIVRDDDVVHWEWHVETPMSRGVTFDAAAYDTEVARLVADTTWEPPARRAGRLVLEGVDRSRLEKYGLRVAWVATSHRDAGQYTVCLQDEDYQVFVDVPWAGRSPDDLAVAAVAELARPPKKWRARWHAMNQRLTGPPSYASRRWSHYGL